MGCPILLVTIFAVNSALVAFVHFVSRALVSRGGFFVLILFLVPLLCFYDHGDCRLLGFSLVSNVIYTTLVIFFFFSAFGSFSFGGVCVCRFPDVASLFSRDLRCVGSIALPVAILTLFTERVDVGGRTTILNVSLKDTLLLLAIFGSVLLFNARLSNRFDCPCTSTVDAIAFNGLFSQLSNFTCFVCFMSSLVGVAIYIDAMGCRVGGVGLGKWHRDFYISLGVFGFLIGCHLQQGSISY